MSISGGKKAFLTFDVSCFPNGRNYTLIQLDKNPANLKYGWLVLEDDSRGVIASPAARRGEAIQSSMTAKRVVDVFKGTQAHVKKLCGEKSAGMIIGNTSLTYSDELASVIAGSGRLPVPLGGQIAYDTVSLSGLWKRGVVENELGDFGFEVGSDGLIDTSDITLSYTLSSLAEKFNNPLGWIGAGLCIAIAASGSVVLIGGMAVVGIASAGMTSNEYSAAWDKGASHYMRARYDAETGDRRSANLHLIEGAKLRGDVLGGSADFALKSGVTLGAGKLLTVRVASTARAGRTDIAGRPIGFEGYRSFGGGNPVGPNSFTDGGLQAFGYIPGATKTVAGPGGLQTVVTTRQPVFMPTAQDILFSHPRTIVRSLIPDTSLRTSSPLPAVIVPPLYDPGQDGVTRYDMPGGRPRGPVFVPGADSTKEAIGDRSEKGKPIGDLPTRAERIGDPKTTHGPAFAPGVDNKTRFVAEGKDGDVEINPAAPKRRRSRKATLAAEPESELQPHESRDVSHTVRYYRFRHGTLAPNHPAQIYVDELARAIPRKNGDPEPRVFLLPDWKAVNACAFPDGTIFISWSLFEFVQSREALLGVIAHEYTHARRQHSEKVGRAVKEGTFIERVLKGIGLKRIHEYEADLRGALEILGKMGESPLPFKAFLIDLHEREKERAGSHGIVHGSSLDRALNIATAAYLVDLSGVDKPPIPIPTELRGDPHAMGGTTSNRAITEKPQFSLRKRPEETPARRAARMRAIEELSKEDLPLAIDTLLEGVKFGKGTKDEDPDDLTALNLACERLAVAILGRPPATAEDRMTVLAALWLGTSAISFGGIKYFHDYKRELLPVESYYVNPEELLKTPEDLESFRKAIERVVESGALAISAGDINKEWRFFLYYVLDRGILRDKDSKNVDPELFENFLGGFAATLARASERLGVNKPVTEDELKDINTRDLSEKDRSDPNVQKVLAKYSTSATFNEAHLKIAQELALLPFPQFVKKLPQIGRELLGTFNGKPRLSDLGKAITAIYNEIVEVRAWNEIRDKKFEGPSLGENTIAVAILRWFLFENGLFDDIPLRTRRAYVFASAVRFNAELNEKRHMYVDESTDANDVSRMKFENTLSDEGQLYEERPDPDFAPLLYSLLIDFDFYERELGAYPSMPGRGGAEMAHYAVSILSELEPKDMLSQLDRWKEAGADIETLLAENPELCGRLQMRLASAIQDGTIKAFDLSSALRLGRWIVNPNLQAMFERFVIAEHWPRMGFDEKLDAAFPLPGKIGIHDPRFREKFVEEDILSEGQFHRAKERLTAILDDATTEGRAEAGLAVIGDINMRDHDVVSVLQALLQTGRGDREIKGKVYELVRESDRLDADTEKGLVTSVVEDTQNADTILRALFVLDPLGKALLLRKLLVGQGGALTEDPKRQKLLKMLLGEWVKEKQGEEDVAKTLLDIREALGASREWEPLYFALQGVLADHVAVAPAGSKVASWSSVWPIQEDFDQDPSLIAQFRRKFDAVVPADAKKHPWLYDREYALLGEARLETELKDVSAETGPRYEQMTPLRFVREAASRLGAMGVRFLQLLPQMVELKPEHEAAFAEIYDRVRGQSKLAAMTLLEREWHGVWEEIEELEERVGGGSMVTVYKAKTRGGRYEAIRVRNPNIIHHVEEAYRFARGVLDDLVKKHPESAGYKAARMILDDIREWVIADANFEGFLQADGEFRRWTDDSNFSAGRYKVYIPKSRGPANPFFSREEFVRGTNLTDWDALVRAGHDMKSVVGLYARYYAAQVQNGLALSDIHPGNISVTEDGRVVIYDRNFYLTLNANERAVIAAVMTGRDADAIRSAIRPFLPDGGGVEHAALERVSTSLAENVARQDFSGAQRDIVALRQLGVKLPLDVTLILKNFNVLQQMAKRAGFGDLGQALTYEPR